jgi:peroxin-5
MATEAYFNALQMNPSFLRARYNLAIASIHLGQYREAAEHLLGALAIQQRNIDTVLEKMGQGASQMSSDWVQHLHEHQSDPLWTGLRLLMNTYGKLAIPLECVCACDGMDADCVCSSSPGFGCSVRPERLGAVPQGL